MNLSGQLQKIHNLCDTSPRDAFADRDPGLGEAGIVVEFLPPRLCQQEGVHPWFVPLWQFIGRRSEILQDAGREGERVNDERLSTPAGKGNCKGQA